VRQPAAGGLDFAVERDRALPQAKMQAKLPAKHHPGNQSVVIQKQTHDA
jgi:hypothetical protein